MQRSPWRMSWALAVWSRVHARRDTDYSSPEGGRCWREDGEEMHMAQGVALSCAQHAVRADPEEGRAEDGLDTCLA